MVETVPPSLPLIHMGVYTHTQYVKILRFKESGPGLIPFSPMDTHGLYTHVLLLRH